jgi:hypothetical protein
MPWTSSDAHAKTKKAASPKKKRQWKDIENSVLKKTGDEGKAVKTANGVLKRLYGKKE